MTVQPKRPKTVNRLQRLITDWERDSGLPVRRLNLRVASMMLAGALPSRTPAYAHSPHAHSKHGPHRSRSTRTGLIATRRWQQASACRLLTSTRPSMWCMSSSTGLTSPDSGERSRSSDRSPRLSRARPTPASGGALTPHGWRTLPGWTVAGRDDFNPPASIETIVVSGCRRRTVLSSAIATPPNPTMSGLGPSIVVAGRITARAGWTWTWTASTSVASASRGADRRRGVRGADKARARATGAPASGESARLRRSSTRPRYLRNPPRSRSEARFHRRSRVGYRPSPQHPAPMSRSRDAPPQPDPVAHRGARMRPPPLPHNPHWSRPQPPPVAIHVPVLDEICACLPRATPGETDSVRSVWERVFV